MARQLRTGDRAAGRSSGGESVGREIKSPERIKGHAAAAAHDNPEYLVRSRKPGRIAAYKPSALRRVK